MQIKDIEKKAAELRDQLGGKIFAFPLDDADPFSKYAVSVFTGITFNTYPEPLNISEAAAGILATLEGFKENGWDADYERNVRLLSGEAQINAPDVTMRRLKKDNRLDKVNVSKAVFQEGGDVTFRNEEEGHLITARGLLKWTCMEMIEEKNPKAIQFMDGYYKLLATKKYGKTAAAIKQEVRRMNKNDVVNWIESTYKKYIGDDMEVFNLMQNLSQGATT